MSEYLQPDSITRSLIRLFLHVQPNPCLSAIKGVNQAFARFTPFFTPKNVKLGVFVFFKILQKNVNYKAIGISMDWQNEPL